VQCTHRTADRPFRSFHKGVRATILAKLAIGKRPAADGKIILAIVPSFAERYLSTLFEGI
jgi:hypothetical protein